MGYKKKNTHLRRPTWTGTTGLREIFLVAKAFQRFKIYRQDEKKDISQAFNLLKFPQKISQSITQEVSEKLDIKPQDDGLNDK